MSGRLKKYLSDFSPQIVYLQISNYESIKFSIELIDYLQIPSVLHMMDDWPSTISSRGLLKKYWHRIIDREFRLLLDKTNLHLSISDAMSDEFLMRYGKRFMPFHNSIELERFNVSKKAENSEVNRLRILYVGRIGKANRSSLLSFAKGISACTFPGFSVEFHIYTKDYNSTDAHKISRLNKVRIFQAVEHNDIPALLVSHDILLLPLDFTDSGLKFSRLSMPTKAIEYMASGTPILVYAPTETAIYRFCDRNECAHCLTSQGHQELSSSLDKIFTDSEYRDKLTSNAKQISFQLFDAVKVRHEFRNTISDLLTVGN
jgi:glycosyltransferase involved in cell wall biosynthesis